MTAQPQDRAKRPTGRRVGDSGTREAIQDAAMALFSERGYDATSMRAVAAAARVDPALVRHFYADKPTLFASTFTARTDIPQRLSAALAGPPDSIGQRVADTYLQLWDDPSTRPILLGLAKAAMTSQAAAAMLAEAMGLAIVSRAQPVGLDPQRLVIAASHLLGVAIARHIIKLPPITAMTHDQLVNAVTPAIQQYLHPAAAPKSPAP